jgi:hypothetical protein
MFAPYDKNGIVGQGQDFCIENWAVNIVNPSLLVL